MKRIKYFATLSFLILSFVFIACEDEDKAAYNLHTESENTAPYVRIILDNSTVDSSVLSDAVISGTVDAPSKNVKSWSAKVRIDGSMTTDFTEIISVTSFPAEVNISIEEIADKLEIDIMDIQPADIIEFSAVSEGVDGKILNYDLLAGDLSGQPEQRQAYEFEVIVFCAPISSNFIGDWTIVMTDTYGDGWDGAFITATIDGNGTTYTTSGSGETHVITIPSGTTSLVWSYSSGAYEEEHIFTITDPAGISYGPFDGGDGIPFCFL